jgi:hypothetical protein
MVMVYADISTLLDAIVAGDRQRVIQATLRLLGAEKVPPAKVAARVGIPAAWGDGEIHPLMALSVSGRVAEWMRSLPIGSEPGAETRRDLAPALPLVQGFLAVAEPLRRGLPEPHPELPEPVVPADVHHKDGALGALREAVATHDLTRTRSILMGYYATGTDYRSVLNAIYAALDHRYPEGGHPLIAAAAGSDLLDMADWGDRMPAYIYWLTPSMVSTEPDVAPAEAARAYAAAAEHDLGWLRKRLAIPKEEVAGAGFQRAVVAGDAATACDAVLRALRDGATPIGVAAALAVAAAQQVNAVPRGDLAALLRAGHVLLYAHAIHVAMLQTQNPEVWPLLYTGACAVNANRVADEPGAVERGAAATPSTPFGGLMPAGILRTLEQQLAQGDTAGAGAAASRYIQMGHPPRALAGVLGNAAASRDILPEQPHTLHTLPMVAAAAGEYLSLPRSLQADGHMTLLRAAIRLCSELGSEQRTLADQVQAAIEEQAAS